MEAKGDWRIFQGRHEESTASQHKASGRVEKDYEIGMDSLVRGRIVRRICQPLTKLRKEGLQ
jgi:hypothetical protein